MSDFTKPVESVNGGNLVEREKPVWGAAAIGKEINRTERSARHLLESGIIKSAKKIGGRWTAYPSALRTEFGG